MPEPNILLKNWKIWRERNKVGEKQSIVFSFGVCMAIETSLFSQKIFPERKKVLLVVFALKMIRTWLRMNYLKKKIKCKANSQGSTNFWTAYWRWKYFFRLDYFFLRNWFEQWTVKVGILFQKVFCLVSNIYPKAW